MLRFYTILVVFLTTTLTFSQAEFEVSPPDYIKTIIFKSNTDQSELPVLKLNERLELTFDVLNSEEADFYYEIEHFNFDWTPSRVIKAQYLDGFDNLRIQEYQNSFNTYQIYSHYRLQIPNAQTQLRLSGNYMLKIYDEYGDLMFSRKFMVYEDQVQVGVAIKRSRNVKYIAQKQSVDIRVVSPNMAIRNPEQTIKTLVVQNNNLNTAISDLKPQYMLGNELRYNYKDESSFWGGNEYFFFDNKDERSANMGVQFIDLKEIYHSYLFANIPRFDRPYTYNPDINGNFLITAIDVEDVSNEADYLVVHFALQHPEFFDKDVYVYGGFNNYALNEDNKMTFNSRSGFYETAITLKQGFYNYKYVTVDNNGNLDEGGISGNFDQTENNYKVLIYYRDFGARYDKIIGFGEGSSTLITN